MVKEGYCHPGASLVGFNDLVRAHLDGTLATYGFRLETSSEEPHRATRRYRNGDRYIAVEAATFPTIAPVALVKLGQGTADGHEAEWNHLPLRHLVNSTAGDPAYSLDGVRLSVFIEQVAKELQDFAMDFICGRMEAFSRARAEYVKLRPSFMPVGSGPHPQSTIDYMKASRLLKQKYSGDRAA